MATTAHPSVRLRRATLNDLDALVSADLAVDVEDLVGEVIEAEGWTETDLICGTAIIQLYNSVTYVTLCRAEIQVCDT